MRVLRTAFLESPPLPGPVTPVLHLDTHEHQGLLLGTCGGPPGRVLAYDDRSGERGPAALNLTRSLQTMLPSSAAHHLLQAVRQWCADADAASLQAVCEHVTLNPSTVDAVYTQLLVPCEPVRTLSLLRKYALSDQAEPFVPYLPLWITDTAQLELGVWTDQGTRCLFLDGVPVNLHALHGEPGLDPLLGTLAHVLSASPGSLRALRDVPDQALPHLIQVLRGESGHSPKCPL
ncbi:hypothetical protein [Deinococcus ficus]|uniref:Uncharacterized protein n=1 Tax=Deinococcus ficus TaxID=317577 RepID=A0A221T2U7_9DEIO|nr:hypothetical protein [Deinococcus ficus]ASN83180.1 hypothetical protein DFI_18440 [Deinococcus ficus]